MNQHIGSNFDDFLEEEGIREEVELMAVKKTLALQIAAVMEEQHLKWDPFCDKDNEPPKNHPRDGQ